MREEFRIAAVHSCERDGNVPRCVVIDIETALRTKQQTRIVVKKI